MNNILKNITTATFDSDVMVVLSLKTIEYDGFMGITNYTPHLGVGSIFYFSGSAGLRSKCIAEGILREATHEEQTSAYLSYVKSVLYGEFKPKQCAGGFGLLSCAWEEPNNGYESFPSLYDVLMKYENGIYFAFNSKGQFLYSNSEDKIKDIII